MKPKKIISLKKLKGDLKKAFTSLYGNDYSNHITEFKDPRDNKVHKAVPLETEEAIYLVILDKKKTTKKEEVIVMEDSFLNEEESGQENTAINMAEQVDNQPDL